MDYKKIGLKAGLEIHQQLDTGKLFSRTPSLLRSDEPDYEIMRKLHVVAGETGEVDEAVKHEALKNREFIYQGYNDTISLVELDEEPPQKIDEDALGEALKVALLLNCEVYTTTQVMRKTVIDGSNTSGFQRTVLIAHDGFVETSFGKVGIESLALEEDAARIISRDSKRAVFRLDRLGIPLIEITTKPELDTPMKIKETALKIGEILRACKVKRGIGTIRQDLNISIKGHDRVEIKGFQDPKMFITTVEKEIERQLVDIKSKKILGEVRNALPSGESEFLRPMPGSARMYPETDLPLLKISRELLNSLKKHLPKLRTEIKSELEKKGLSDEMIPLILDGNLDEFEVLLGVYDKDANLIAKAVSLWRNEFASKMGKSFDEVKEILSESILEKVFEKVDSGELEKNDVKSVLWDILQGKSIEEALKIEKVDHNEIGEFVLKIVKEKPGMRPNAYMGLVMKEFKGKVDAKKAMEIINSVLKD